MSKSPDAFRTISEVADWLGVQAHVLRFWESRFSQVKPVKRAGGRRYYRPNDMRLLGGIKKLLHEDGITIKGVQRILREQGVNYVAALSHGLDEDPTSAADSDETVVAFAPKTPTPSEQIRMDLGEPASGPAASAAEQGSSAPTDPAPQPRGVASLAWSRPEFDDDLLRRIAPIAHDLRKWLRPGRNTGCGIGKKAVFSSCPCRESLYEHLNVGLWRSLVARPSGGRKVAGSSPASPTKSHRRLWHTGQIPLWHQGGSE